MGRKALKRKLGKRVINGTMTLAQAWDRLDHAGREAQARQVRQVGKSAGGPRPGPAGPVYRPGRRRSS